MKNSPEAIGLEVLRSRIHTLFDEKRRDNPTIREGGIKAELEHLADEIEKHKGKVVILMHPFFEKHSLDRSPFADEIRDVPGEKEIFDECNRNIDVLLSSTDRPPIIILEDRRHMGSCFKHCVEHSISLDRDVYIVPTFVERGTVYFGPVMDHDESGEVHPLVVENYLKRVEEVAEDDPIRSPAMDDVAGSYRAKSWFYLLAVLEELGAKVITLGGKYLDICDDFEEGKPDFNRCLGEAYTYMNFLVADTDLKLKVDIGDGITYPLSRDDIKDFLV